MCVKSNRNHSNQAQAYGEMSYQLDLWLDSNKNEWQQHSRWRRNDKCATVRAITSRDTDTTVNFTVRDWISLWINDPVL